MYVCLLVVLYICFTSLVRKNGFGRLPEAKLSINQSINQSTEMEISLSVLLLKCVYMNIQCIKTPV